MNDDTRIRTESGAIANSERVTVDFQPDPELELVIQCVRSAGSVASVERVRALASDSDVDWDRVLALARRHHVTPLVYDRLRSTRSDAVPETVRGVLRDRYRANAIRNRYVVSELCAILAAFDANGIGALTYKGPVLARTAYDDVSRRRFVDLDLLVSKDDLSRATAVLTDRGYTWFEGPTRPPTAVLSGGPFVPPLAYEWKLKSERLVVELGWQLHTPSVPLDLDFEALRKRAVTISFSAGDVRGLSPVDRLLVLAHHGAKHRWSQLKWICDVAEAVRNAKNLSWETVLDRARDARVARKVRIALGLSISLFDVPTDRTARRAVFNDERAIALVTEVLEQYRAEPLAEPSARDEQWYRVRSTDSVGDAVVAATAPLRPTLAEYRYRPLSPRLYPLYYLLRPVRLLGREARSLLEGP